MSDDQFDLPEELAALALKDFGETKERRSAALLELRARIEALPEPSDRLSDTSDANIIRFLRASTILPRCRTPSPRFILIYKNKPRTWVFS